MARGPATVIGVDLGGTWLRVTGLSDAGVRVFSTQRPTPPAAELARVLRSLLASRPKADRLTVAARGVWDHRDRTAMSRMLRGIARSITVIPDVEAAWWSAFGSSETPFGLVVVAGTGSIALAKTRQGRWIREGGLGPYLGDEGSGFWIGREWLRYRIEKGGAIPILRVLRQQTQPVRWIAQQAHDALKRAHQGDRRARRLIDHAQRHLVGSPGTELEFAL